MEDLLLKWHRMWHQAHAEILDRFQRKTAQRSLLFVIDHTLYSPLKHFLAPDNMLEGKRCPAAATAEPCPLIAAAGWCS